MTKILKKILKKQVKIPTNTAQSNNRITFLFDIYRTCNLYILYKNLHHWIKNQLPLEVYYTLHILHRLPYDSIWLKYNVLHYLHGNTCLEPGFVKCLLKNLIETHNSDCIEFICPVINNRRAVYEVALTNAYIRPFEYNPLYVIFSHLISKNCVPNDLFTNNQYRYTSDLSIAKLISSIYCENKRDYILRIDRKPKWKLNIINSCEEWDSMPCQILTSYHIVNIILKLKKNNHLLHDNYKELQSYFVHKVINTKSEYKYKRPLIFQLCDSLHILSEPALDSPTNYINLYQSIYN